MEEQLAKLLELARGQGISENDLLELFGRKSLQKNRADYLIARSAGLTIAQAEFACVLKNEIVDKGLESLSDLIGTSKFSLSSMGKKRNRKICKDEPKLTKKRKNCK
jgi:hypothetical protein